MTVSPVSDVSGSDAGAHFLSGDTAMGALVRSTDWSKTPLGPIETWPQSLRTTVSLCLASNFPINIIWGPENTQIYNDGYRVVCGEAHPRALGERYDVTWASAWPAVGEPFRRARAGETTFLENQRMFLTRNGYLEETYFSLSLSPIRDESGGIGGLFHPVTETTETMLAERRTRALRDLTARLGSAATSSDLVANAVATLAQYQFDLPFVLFYALAADAGGYRLAGRHGVAAGPAAAPDVLLADAGAPWPVGLASTGPGMTEMAEVAPLFGDGACGPYAEPPQRAFVLPITVPGSERPPLIVIAGVSPRLPLDDVYRGFYEKLAAALAAALSTVRAREDERRRAEALAEIDRAKTAVLANVSTEEALRWLPDGGQEPANTEAPATVARTSAGRVLVADDNSDMRAYVGRLLAAEGMTVEGVTDGEAALVAVRRQRPDLIVSDVMMPTLDGFGLLARLRADPNFADIPVVLLSARAGEEARVEGTEAGADDYLIKPVSARELVARVSAHLSLARERREAALQASAIRFEAIANSIDQMVWSTRADGYHDYFNQRWYDFTGVPQGSTDGEGWNGLFHPDDQQRTWVVWRQSLETGVPYYIEYRLRHRSGDYRWVLGRAQPVRDSDGRIVRWYGTCTDIHALKEAEAALRVQSEEFYALADNIPLLCWIARADGHIYWYNHRWYEYTGTSPETQEGWGWESVHDPDYLPEVVKRWTYSLERGEPFEMTFPLKGADGAYRPFLTRVVPIRDETGAITRWFGSNVDITEVERTKAELRQLNEGLEQRVAEALAAREEIEQQLRQSQKMEAVGQLTGGIAHDFNNMLAVVIGSLDLLGRRVGDDARAKRYVDAASEGARRAALLTQRLLAFSRQQPLRPEPVDANKLVAGMSDLLRQSLGGVVQLETVHSGGLWRTFADPNQLENVILNLAVNGRDAMAHGGRLTIETQNAHLDERYAAAHLGISPGQYVLIAVSDTGTGMTEDVVAKAFDPFFTTKEVGKGTGLGLSQVYGFVKQSGGHIKVYSEVGQGTTVKVYLPRFLGPEPDVVGGESSDASLLGEAQEVILVVEDEPAVRQFTAEALTELGYCVLEADGAVAALDILDKHPEISLMFTDVVMPGINGAKLATEARRRRPDLKVLFTTGYTRNAVVHNGVLDADVELIGKPFTVEELAVRLRQMFEHPKKVRE